MILCYYIKQSEYRMQEVLPTDLYILVLRKWDKFHLCGPNAVHAVQNSEQIVSLCRLMTALRIIDVGVNLRQQWISAEQQEQKGYEVF